MRTDEWGNIVESDESEDEFDCHDVSISSDDSSCNDLPMSNETDPDVVKNKIHACDSCDKQFTRKDSLNQHVTNVHRKAGGEKRKRVDTQGGPPEKVSIASKDCVTCGKTFSNCYSLKRHMTTMH